MSCSKDKAINHLVKKNLVKPSLDLYSPLPTSELMNEIDRLTKLAKDKYNVDMGPLFRVRYRDVSIGSYSIMGASSVVTKSRLEPNDPAFEAIDRSPVQSLNKIRKELDDYRHQLQVARDYEKIQEEGNFIVSEDGDVVVPSFLPKINIRC